jgi:hypothetical protein
LGKGICCCCNKADANGCCVLYVDDVEEAIHREKVELVHQIKDNLTGHVSAPAPQQAQSKVQEESPKHDGDSAIQEKSQPITSSSQVSVDDKDKNAGAIEMATVAAAAADAAILAVEEL